jgi:hypothetical protein
VNAGTTTNAEITVSPLAGNGAFCVAVSWPPGIITNPVVTGTLAPVNGAPVINLAFNLAGNNLSATYENQAVPAGYYILNVQLCDGSIVKWGGVESVRIIAGQTSSGSYPLTANPGQIGDINLIINPDLQNPITITFSGQQDLLPIGTDMTVIATPSEPVDSYQWYLNGKLVNGADSPSITIGKSLGQGDFRLDVVVKKGVIASSGFITFTVSGGQIPLHGLIGEWLLNGNALDSSGYQNHGTIYGPVFTPGYNGQAGDFNGVGDYIQIPSYMNFNNLTAFTLSAWIYPTNCGYLNPIISKVNPMRDFVLDLQQNGKLDVHFGFGYGQYHWCTSDDPVPLNQWSHVVAVWTGTKWQLYLNGNLIKEADCSGYAPVWTGTVMEIGAMNSEYFFDGMIDEVKVFNYALTSPEINALCGNSSPASLKGYWQFEGNANDLSGNNANGTLVNGACYSGGIIGQGINVNGTAHVDIANCESFNNVTMQSFTLSAWIYPTNYGYFNPIISKVNPNRDFVLDLQQNGKIDAHFGDIYGYHWCTSDNPVPLNQWSYVAAVWTGTQWRLYLNGYLIKETDCAGYAPAWTGTVMEIGAMNSEYFFDGTIDEVKVFGNALTSAQISAEWANGNPTQ